VEILILLIMILAGYLSGSVSYATAVTRLVSGKEIREIGSRNPGTLNVGANLGRGWGVLVGLFDGLKSFLPMLVTEILLKEKSESFLFVALMAVGIAAIIGHWKPIFHGFKGGQCVGTTIGVFLFIIPIEFLFSFFFAGILIFFVMRKLVEKWVRWVPLTFILLVPIVTILANALIDIPFFAHISLGGHPWYWMGGIGTICILMLVINLSYIRKRINEVKQ
jgi:acyl phosphate:glycerol-3-phosphate acyltransferase